MNLKIDEEKCIGCGTCVALAVNSFEISGDKAIVKETVADDEEVIKMAISACPTLAISE